MSTENKELETLYPQGKKMVIGGEEFFIKPFVLNNRTKVVRIFASIFAELGQNADIAKSGNIEVVIKFIETAGDRIIEIYEIITGKDKEWLGANLTLKQEVELINTVMEINDFPFLVGQVKRAMATMPKQSQSAIS